MANNNRDPNKEKATTGEMLAGGLTTAAQAAAGGYGVGKIAGPITGSVGQGFKQFGKNVALEAGVGAGQDVIGQLGTSVGTEKGASLDPNQVLGNALTQGLTASALKAPALARNAATALELRGVNNEQNQATYAANLLKQVQESNPGLDINNTKDTGTILNKALALNSERINDSMSRVKKMMEESNLQHATTELDGLRQNADSLAIVKDAKKKTGMPVGDEAVNHIERMVGGTAEGQMLVSSLRAQSALKALNAQGRQVGDHFIGGIAARLPFLEKAAHSKLASLVGMGGAAGAALLHQAPIFQGAVASFIANPLPALGVAAVPAGLYGGARAIDALTGSRNPVNRFASRFADPSMGTVPDTSAPSVTNLLNQAKARKNAQDEAFRDLRNQKYDLVNQTLQQRVENTPDLVAARLDKEASVSEANRARASVHQAKADAIPALTEANVGLVNERTTTQAERTNTQREATRTQAERTANAAATTETTKKTGEQKVAEATARKEAAQSRARAADLRAQLVQLRADKAAAGTKAEKAVVAKKIESTKAKLAKEQAKGKTSQSTGEGSSSTSEPNSSDTTGTTTGRMKSIDNKAETFRRYENAVRKRTGIDQGTANAIVELSQDLNGRVNNVEDGRAAIAQVAEAHPAHADFIRNWWEKPGAKLKDTNLGRVMYSKANGGPLMNRKQADKMRGR
jgi:hypothetical protein